MTTYTGIMPAAMHHQWPHRLRPHQPYPPSRHAQARHLIRALKPALCPRDLSSIFAFAHMAFNLCCRRNPAFSRSNSLILSIVMGRGGAMKSLAFALSFSNCCLPPYEKSTGSPFSSAFLRPLILAWYASSVTASTNCSRMPSDSYAIATACAELVGRRLDGQSPDLGVDAFAANCVGARGKCDGQSLREMLLSWLTFHSWRQDSQWSGSLRRTGILSVMMLMTWKHQTS
ncbi:hypothetical protein QBC34DRAFT_163883 [Podospora aff. communis PSN243]|uniref:Polyketide synthase n=1 Tax=Podospora aff. communis PSN243 TaxID=3040156 RepID=A0AAV9GE50_9PEZI|nr:hypothetical protein QBC34DRAFT_163883 [Podospora aff. communis PSN243]